MKIALLKWILLSIALILLTEILNNVLNTKELYYNSLAEQLSKKQIEKIFSFQDKWRWVMYLIVPLIMFLKTSLIASVLYIGIFFLSKIPVTFKQLWSIVLSAEFAFLLVPVFKMAWFYFFQTNYKLEDIQNFYPLSALNITGYKNLEPWYIYPLQTLNLFEFLYIIYLGFQIGKITNTNADHGLKIMSLSYVPALFLWIATIMFFTLNYS